MTKSAYWLLGLSAQTSRTSVVLPTVLTCDMLSLRPNERQSYNVLKPSEGLRDDTLRGVGYLRERLQTLLVTPASLCVLSGR
jgi:hypothetical protein